jgi:MFS superfamily sulfate permease-like transporter
MEVGYWTIIGVGIGVVLACFARILVKVASNRNHNAGYTYKRYKVKGKYKTEPTLA